MKQPIVIIGIGELGGVFAKAFLHAGYPANPPLFSKGGAPATERLFFHNMSNYATYLESEFPLCKGGSKGGF